MRTLLLTGATGGLGIHVARRLSRDYRCVSLHRGDQPPDENVYGIVLMAGAFTMGSSLDDFAKMLDANLTSAVRAIEPMRSRIDIGGRIVAISSAASLTKPDGMAAYTASKAALNAYVETLAKELQPQKITVNALLPTALDTPAMQGVMKRASLVPLERVSETIAFLLTEEAQSVTGQLIVLAPGG